MLTEIRKRPESPLRTMLEKLAMTRLASRIALEAYRGMSAEEIGLRLSLSKDEAEEVIEFGVGRGTLERRGGLVHKARESA